MKKYRTTKGRLVMLAAILMFFYGFILGGQQLVIVDIAAEYQTGQKGMGFLISVQYMAAVLMPICMGAVADKVGKKKILVAFIAIFGIGCLFSGLSNRVFLYLLGAFLIGSGYSVCETLCSALMTDLDSEQGMRYINITQFLLSIGAIISPVLICFCMDHLGADWRLTFWICAAAFFVLTIMFGRTPFPEKKEKIETSVNRKQGYSNWQIGMLSGLFIAIVLYVGLENGFGYFVNLLFAIHLRSEDLGAVAISAYWAGMAASRFLCGLRSYHPQRMLLTCFFLASILFAMLILLKLPWLSVGICCLLGVVYGPIWGTLVALAGGISPENSAGAIGFMSTGCGLGGILYPVLMGALSEAFSLRTAFWCLSMTAMAGFLICLGMTIMQRKKGIKEIGG